MSENKVEVLLERRIQLGRTIENQRKIKGFGFNELAMKAGINSKTLNDIINAKSKKVNALIIKELSKVLDLDYKKLYQIVGYLDANDLDIAGNVKINTKPLIEIPLYDSVSAGAGMEPDSVASGTTYIDRELGKDCLGITVYGDSMEQTIMHNSIIVVNPNLHVDNGNIGVFIHDNDALVKRFKIIDKHYYLISDNHDYPDREVREGDEFKIIGKVVRVINKLD